jgi:hypothetical protein
LRRKLVLLNVVLAGLIGGAAWRLRVEWLAARQHEKAVLGQLVKAAAAPPFSALPGSQPVVPVQYQDIAQKDLFTKDRNPNVAIEPPPAPPPPPPMPALPVLRGVLNIGGIAAIMSENPRAPQKEVRPGGVIGEFKLLAVNNQEIILEWKGEQIRRRVEELFDHSVIEPPPTAAVAAPAGGAALGQSSANMTPKIGSPGVDIGNGRKACLPGETTPDGTVVQGLKKVSWETPFGKGCAWETPGQK